MIFRIILALTLGILLVKLVTYLTYEARRFPPVEVPVHESGQANGHNYGSGRYPDLRR